jgi:hypothetical protein
MGLLLMRNRIKSGECHLGSLIFCAIIWRDHKKDMEDGYEKDFD